MHIRKLTLYTSRLPQQIDFYSRILELRLLSADQQQATFQAGDTRLNFVADETATPCHFAFNIPWGSEAAALDWLRQRVPVLPTETGDIQEFPAWKARAIYFYDADQNIVEFIARQDVPARNRPRGASGFVLHLSEIGLASTDIEGTYRQLNELTGMEVYDGSFNRFCAIGDAYGLFICVDPAAKTWYPAGDRVYDSPFTINFWQSGSSFTLACHSGRFRSVGE